MRKSTPAACEHCAGRVRMKKATVDLRRGSALVVVEAVPARVCDTCGYQYFSLEVAERLRRLFSRRVKARRRLKVPVVRFGSVA